MRCAIQKVWLKSAQERGDNDFYQLMVCELFATVGTRVDATDGRPYLVPPCSLSLLVFCNLLYLTVAYRVSR